VAKSLGTTTKPTLKTRTNETVKDSDRICLVFGILLLVKYVDYRHSEWCEQC